MILWLIACGFCFVAGMLHGQGKLIPWVRGAAGKARGVVFGSRPAALSARERMECDLRQAPESDPFKQPLAEVSPTPPKNPIRAGQATKNILAFIGGLLAWMAKNPMLAIGLVVLVAFLLLGPPSCNPFGKSRGELRLEREIAEANTRIAQHEARLEGLAGALAVNTERDRTRRSQVITQAQQEIEDATAQVDPEAQYGAYVRGYLCLLDPGACAGFSDPAPAGTDPVRSSRADAA